MKIAHFAPFAPGRAGLYETTRDMIVAERLAGHVSELVDNGVSGKRRIGATDERGGQVIAARKYEEVEDFDLFVSNNGMLESFLARTRVPVVQILHGRPASSFRLQRLKPKEAPVYDLHRAAAANPRFRLFISLWPEHLPYWRTVVPDRKLRSVPDPPCDLDWYTPAGEAYSWAEPKKSVNILIADLWREDIDPFEVSHAVIELARRDSDFKVHYLACQPPLGPWEYLFRALRELGVLGETRGVCADMPRYYRAAQIVLSPHHIATRIVRESLACGCLLVADEHCRHTGYRYPVHDCIRGAEVLRRALHDVRNGASVPEEHRCQAQVFNLERFAEAILPLYEEALN